MGITLTENAAKQIQVQLAKRGRGLGLRVGVKKVGCSGFAYTYDYADEARPEDALFESFGTKVYVDAKSLDFMNGSTLDYVKEGLKQAFKFENPNVDAMCGCGESFSVKEPSAVNGQASAETPRGPPPATGTGEPFSADR